MRIVLVGNYNERREGANFYASVRKFTNGFIRNGHQVMSFSDRDVARETGKLGVFRGGDAYANERLIALCRNFRPDLLVLCHADKITNDTVRELRRLRPAMRVAVVNFDALFLPENAERIRRFAEVADTTFVTTADERLRDFVTPTHSLAFIPNPADPSIETLQCFAGNDQLYDLFCAVGAENASTPRGRLLKEIETQVPEARCAFYGFECRRQLSGQDYFDAIAASRMGLNLNRDDSYFLYSSDRLAQYAGNGLLVFVARASGYDEIFTDEEFAFYRDTPELADKLRYFLKNDGERQRIARNGHERYHMLFSERLAARYIEQVMLGQATEDAYAWPTTVYA